MTDRSLPDPIPPPAELHFTNVDPAGCGMAGPRLCWMEAGDPRGAPLLLLHGIGSNSMGWRFVQAGMPECRTIAWNAPGYFLSDPMAAEAPAAEDYARAAVALLDHLGIARAHVVGSSFGSMIGLVLGARHAGRVASLTLLGGSRGQRWKPPEERTRMLAMRTASVAEGGVGLARDRWSNLVAPDTDPVVVDLVRRVLAATNPAAMLQAARCSDATDSMDFAGDVQAASLLVCGTLDRVNPTEVSRALAGAMPRGRLVELDGIGHQAKLEAPRPVISLIRRQVEENPA